MKLRLTLGKKMYIFITAVVLLVAVGVAALSYIINANQIYNFYKRITMNSAENYATLADVDYLKELKAAVLSEEYQTLRDRAEENEDEELVIDYLKDKGLWEKYKVERQKLRTYVENMGDIKYLYIVDWGVEDSKYNMYLLDADDVPIYETGLYEEREPEFLGVEEHESVEPTISNGNWGWLCSAYAPVYNSEGELVCTVGCDLDMADVLQERNFFLLNITAVTFVLTVIVLVVAVIFIRKMVVCPLNRLTERMKGFTPKAGSDYNKAGVVSVDVKSNDEIRDIYEETRSMQIRIIDYINSITQIRREKEMVEDVVRIKEEEIGAISRKAYHDSHTGVRNKVAYVEKTKEMNAEISKGGAEFAVVVMDINMLKKINDTFGHTEGDLYITGCCQMLCDAFGHSTVYRIGGDEFAAVLTESDYRERQSKFTELKKRFAETERNKNRDPWLCFSASLGMAEFTPEDPDFETVFRRADQLMYEAKQEHKENR